MEHSVGLANMKLGGFSWLADIDPLGPGVFCWMGHRVSLNASGVVGSAFAVVITVESVDQQSDEAPDTEANPIGCTQASD